MRNKILFTLALLPFLAVAQKEHTIYCPVIKLKTPVGVINPDSIYSAGVVDKVPEYKEELKRFLALADSHLRLSKQYSKVQGHIIISFVIDKNGNLIQSKTLKNINNIANDSFLKYLEGLPQWKPGIIRGITVNTLYSLPIYVSNKKSVIKDDKVINHE